MTVCALIVTYGDRFHLLTQVLNALKAQGVARVIVVENGSKGESGRLLSEDETKNGGWLSVVRLGANCGSAAGFASAIRAVNSITCDYVWILDDDNRPAPHALAALLDYWSSEVKGRTCLASFRSNRYNYYESFVKHGSYSIVPRLNSYAGFHLGDIWSKFLARTKAEQTESTSNDDKPVVTIASPYGGLFTDKTTLLSMDLPNEDWIIYMDDFDFTIRFSLTGGKIIMVPDSQLTDLEDSYYLPSRKPLLYHSALDSKHDGLAFYSLRNQVCFSTTYLVRSRNLYNLNRLLFKCMITTFAVLRGKRERLKLIRRALADGEKCRMGKTTYDLP
jgi:GT2 family glycosyltransferase